MEKQTKLIIGAVVVLVIFFLGTAVVTQNNRENIEPDFRTIVEDFQDEIPEAEVVIEKADFMEGCVGEDASVAYCDCAYEYILDEIGIKAFTKMSLDLAIGNKMTDKQVDVFGSAVISCMDKI